MSRVSKRASVCKGFKPDTRGSGPFYLGTRKYRILSTGGGIISAGGGVVPVGGVAGSILASAPTETYEFREYAPPFTLDFSPVAM
ncbi:MAG: hypothetical protein ACI8V7_000361 [Candidatus Paceibacteria bacterium]|jgi:hypothetical protein